MGYPMPENSVSPSPVEKIRAGEISNRSAILYAAQADRIFRRTDRAFALLLLAQWAASIVIAIVVSPKAWAGSESHIHPHVWTALFLGGIITLCPLALTIRAPGHSITRHIIAVSQI